MNYTVAQNKDLEPLLVSNIEALTISFTENTNEMKVKNLENEIKKYEDILPSDEEMEALLLQLQELYPDDTKDSITGQIDALRLLMQIQAAIEKENLTQQALQMLYLSIDRVPLSSLKVKVRKDLEDYRLKYGYSFIEQIDLAEIFIDEAKKTTGEELVEKLQNKMKESKILLSLLVKKELLNQTSLISLEQWETIISGSLKVVQRQLTKLKEISDLSEFKTLIEELPLQFNSILNEQVKTTIIERIFEERSNIKDYDKLNRMALIQIARYKKSLQSIPAVEKTMDEKLAEQALALYSNGSITTITL